MADELRGRTIAILAADGVEQVELVQPRQALHDAGARTALLSLEDGEIQAMNSDINPAGRFAVERLVSEASVEDYDALVLPGGTCNPDKLRMEDKAVQLVKDFCAAGKPVAAICHGPWLLVEADVVNGKTVTSWPSIRTDLENAGANVVDQEVATDGNLITSRNPDDIPAFNQALISALQTERATADA